LQGKNVKEAVDVMEDESYNVQKRDLYVHNGPEVDAMRKGG
jgi:hypothetical protein